MNSSDATGLFNISSCGRANALLCGGLATAGLVAPFAGAGNVPEDPRGPQDFQQVDGLGCGYLANDGEQRDDDICILRDGDDGWSLSSSQPNHVICRYRCPGGAQGVKTVTIRRDSVGSRESCPVFESRKSPLFGVGAP